MNLPIDLPTRETCAFLGKHLPDGCSVIEVGCGAGHVAVALQARGFDVTAVDDDAEVVAAAKGKGVNAVQAAWPAVDLAPADAVIFTRSLHHIEDLDSALGKAAELLKPGGQLILEEFAFEAANPATVEWFARELREGTVSAAIVPGRDEFIDALMKSDNPWQAWLDDHHHHIHTFISIKNIIAQQFFIQNLEFPAYFYRNVISALGLSESNYQIAEKFLIYETDAIRSGAIAALGARLVAKC